MDKYGERIDETTVRFVRILPGPIERVWDYLTDAGEAREVALRRRYRAAGRRQSRDAVPQFFIIEQA